MAENYNIDLTFEPASRPRSCTWPSNRPNNEDGTTEKSLKIEPTIEETEETTDDIPMTEQPACHVGQSSYMESIDYSQNNSLVYPVTESNPTNLVNDFSGIILTPSSNSTQNNPENDKHSSFIDPKVCNLPAESFNKSKEESNQNTPPVTVKLELAPASGQQPQQYLPTQDKACNNTNSPVISSTTPLISKSKPNSRRNAWGNMSYADLITQAIESSPEKRLTLAQIYDWMVKNVTYFKDKGDSNSSAGWKNSIRHNLSLHSKFKRTQNEGTGKSSWWTINYDAKPGKSPRRRASSMDPPVGSRYKKKCSTTLAKQKAEQSKKQLSLAKNNGVLKQDSPNWTFSPHQEDEFDANARFSEYRQRTSSNASSLGPMSPNRSNSFLLPKELDDDSSLTSSNGNLTGVMNFSVLHQLQKSNEDYNDGFDESQINSYINAPPSHDSTDIGATPNLARLLQQNSIKNSSSSVTKPNSLRSKVTKGLDIIGNRPRSRSNTMPRLQPQPKYDITSPPSTHNSNQPKTMEQLQSSSNNQSQQPNILYGLLSSNQRSSQPSGHETPAFSSTITSPITIMQQQRSSGQQFSSSYNHHQFDNLIERSRLSSSLQPTTRFGNQLPSLQFADKMVADQNTPATQMEVSEDHFPPDESLFGSTFDLEDLDIGQLIGEIKSNDLDGFDLSNYLSSEAAAAESSMDLEMTDRRNDQNNYTTISPQVHPQMHQHQQQIHLQQVQQQQQQQQQQFQLQQLQQQPEFVYYQQLQPQQHQMVQQPPIQQLQPQQNMISNMQFMSPTSNEQGQLLSLQMAPTFEDQSNKSFQHNGTGEPANQHSSYNYQQPCYQQMLPQQHIMLSNQSPISSASNYKT